MLLSKSKFTDSDVVTIKLSSGEELLGRFESEDLGTITLAKPLMIAMTQKGPAMAPFMMTVEMERSLSFNKSLIVTTALTEKEIAGQYVYQTTGIQPVTAGSIIS